MSRWWPTALERRIAMRYLRGQRGTRRAALQTVVAIGGIAVGVTALIVVLGLMNGLRDDLRDRILTASPHLRVLTFGDDLRMEGWQGAAELIRTVDGVVAVAPEVVTGTMAQNMARHVELAKVAGLEPGEGTSIVTGVDQVMVQGEFRVVPPDAEIDAGVVVGVRLAKLLNVRPGDRLRLVAPASAQVSRVTGTVTPVWWVVEVTGIFETGMYIYDAEFLMMDRTSAQRFAGLDSAVSALAVRVSDPWAAPGVAERIDSLLGYPYWIETWQEQNASLFAALNLEKLAMGLVIFFIMIVAAFNIVGTLTMVVAFKTREIGILLAMGLSGRGIGRIFLAQGAIVGLVGTMLGLLLGLTISIIVDRGGLVQIDPSIYFIEHLPIRTEPFDVLIVVVAAIGLAVAATIHPARQAAALEPVEAIRAE
jgi:lipoprotein-releasing system permease protein